MLIMYSYFQVEDIRTRKGEEDEFQLGELLKEIKNGNKETINLF